MRTKNNQIEETEKISLKSQILALRDEAQRSLIEFYDYNDIRRFREFKRKLLRFFQIVRVYIEKSERDYEILEDLDNEFVEKVSRNNGGNEGNEVEKWLNYYQELERVLFDIGITNILKANKFQK